MLIGAVLPLGSWAEVCAFAAQAWAREAHSVWLLDDRDPLVWLSAVAQTVPGLRLGCRSSALAARPAVLAAKQLGTLDLVSDGRLEIWDDDGRAALYVSAMGSLRPLPRQRLIPIRPHDAVRVSNGRHQDEAPVELLLRETLKA